MSVEVITNPSSTIALVLVTLGSATALTFLAFLLSCGLAREDG